MRDVKIVELVRGDTGAFAVSKRSHFVRRTHKTMRRKMSVSYHMVECLTIKNSSQQLLIKRCKNVILKKTKPKAEV